MFQRRERFSGVIDEWRSLVYVAFTSYSKHKRGNSTSPHKAEKTDAKQTSDIFELYSNIDSFGWNIGSLITDDTFALNHWSDAMLLI